MYDIRFYRDKTGQEPVKEYLMKLKEKAKDNKDSRIKANKIAQYIAILAQTGTRAGEKFMKHIQDDIWELRPLDDRIFFFYWCNNTFVFLHCFRKKTKKTPKKEIEQAQRNKQDFLNRFPRL